MLSGDFIRRGPPRETGNFAQSAPSLQPPSLQPWSLALEWTIPKRHPDNRQRPPWSKTAKEPAKPAQGPQERQARNNDKNRTWLDDHEQKAAGQSSEHPIRNSFQLW